ncbi:Fungal lipase-like domain containing protein [Heracleum sosnowskyi]|uniref:Fungal lipase-like domain containing protein n=1 Tax=Heracleum sosnowskyi TaxID=360622 RepID=A0AAD8J7G6_9APIA|nr:Fungal lipase-like domain containing protein [Heracleum sosnowskyi]
MHVQISSLLSFLPALSLNKTYAYANTLGIAKKNNTEVIFTDETVLVPKENENSAAEEAEGEATCAVCRHEGTQFQPGSASGVKDGQEFRNSNKEECNDNCDTNNHPYVFHVSGPRKVSSLNWRDLIKSSWKNEDYRRTVIACFIQAVYLLELDRQENKTEGNSLAPKWWIPFKYKLSQTLFDKRDGSIYGAILEWDRTAALADFIFMRPTGAPRAVLALRGTLLRSPTFRGDIEDDLRFVAWESLEGSVRFNGALETLKAVADMYGGSNVCVAGHSLGAGFALQVGKTLAKQGIFVDTHLFNPPSVSLGLSLKNFGEKAGFVWKRLKSMLPYSNETPAGSEVKADANTSNIGLPKWVPHLYVNESDYICCYYTDPAGAEESKEEKDNENVCPENGQAAAAKLFVLSKGKQKFQEAHGLQQWWSDDLELQLALCNSKLVRNCRMRLVDRRKDKGLAFDYSASAF